MGREVSEIEEKTKRNVKSFLNSKIKYSSGDERLRLFSIYNKAT